MQSQASGEGCQQEYPCSQRECGLGPQEQKSADGQWQAETHEQQAKTARTQSAERAHPAQFVLHQGGETRFMMLRADLGGRQYDPKSQPPDQLTQLMIFGQMIRQSAQATDFFQGL